MRLRVHLDDPPAPAALARLRTRLDPEIELTLGPARPDPALYHVLVDGRPSPEKLAASPDLKMLVIPWAGLPQKTRELMLAYPQIAVHNLHYNADATAEMAVTLMLAAAKFVVPIDAALRQGDWSVRYGGDRSVEVVGKRALILGYGAIGQRVARALVGLGMQVAAMRRHAPDAADPGDPVRIFPSAALPELLEECDVLIITLPLTPETEGRIGKAELALLNEKAILVNVGRGAVVDEQALFDALKSGRLYAAGLDVWYRYPQNEDSRRSTFPSRLPFWELDNVVLSPHRAGDNSETEERRMTCLAELLNLAARGLPVTDRVDVRRGY